MAEHRKVKILVVRFSSMGDIIYTTPVIRCLKKQLPNAEIHYLTKKSFKFLVEHNPYIDKLHLLEDKLSETINQLKNEKFDYLIDLHNSLRSTILKFKLNIKSSTYKKERFKKFLALKFKINLIKQDHLVERYLKTVEFLGVKNDNLPIDYFLPKNTPSIEEIHPKITKNSYVAFVIGATHFTKRLPNYKVVEICKGLNLPIVLLGGKDVVANAIEIENCLPNSIINLVGVVSLNDSVTIVKNAASVIGFDTGLTHIAEAFNKKLVTIWGSTVPELLGVQPYLVEKHFEAGVELSCRPCSKFGLAKCPKGHFKCMNEINEQSITQFIMNG
jgi:ADP-heptose:LPS heptosyltransferase